MIGLVCGLAWPGLAAVVKPTLPVLIAALLFLATFRIGPHAILSSLRDAKATLHLVAIYQLAVPMVLFALAAPTGLAKTTAALAAVLTFSAPSVTGSPNFAILMGQNPTSALRLLVVGTALFPITVLPVLWLLPDIDAGSVVASAIRLAGVILIATGTALALRRIFAPDLSPRRQQALDGGSAILLGVVVVGLMSAVGPMLTTNPTRFLAWLGFAFAVNLGAQLVAWKTLGPAYVTEDRAAASIVAGNRNIALFLVALPATVTDPLLEFIGCYQIPMYLTPILMGRIYNRS